MTAANTILVAGAGAAGLSCALSAASRGAHVYLIERTARLGGTVSQCLIHTIAGLYDDSGNYINTGLPVELAERLMRADPNTSKRKMGKVWVLNVDPATYEQTIESWVASEVRIRVLRSAFPIRIQTEGNRVRGLELETKDEKAAFQADVVVDTTGSAEVVRMVDRKKVVDGDALAGLIIQIRGVARRALMFPKNVGLQRSVQDAVDDGILPTAFAKTWFDTGVSEDEVYAKVNVLAANFQTSQLDEIPDTLMRFLARFPDFSAARLARVGSLGIRDGGRIEGEYRLTLEDIKSGRRFPNSSGRCAWPIEYWAPEKGVTLDYLPPNHSYEIPLSCLKVSDWDNLWAAGKCLSAEKLAQASARVAGTCWATRSERRSPVAHPNNSIR